MNRGAAIAFIDVFALMVMVLFLLPQKPDIAAADESRAGMLVVEARWAAEAHTDVDLWVEAPGDAPVGYSHLRGSYFSLFRDDLGNERSPARYEIAATRTVPDGEYTVNLHLYSDIGQNAPITVDVVCWYRNAEGGKVTVWTGPATLSSVGSEVTVVRWRMRETVMDPASVHFTPKRIRSAVGAP